VKARLTEEMLVEISRVTVDDYAQSAEGFWQGTRDHDVSQNVEALVHNLVGEPPFRILDLGCGPGRDLMTFKNMGHSPVGLDGTREFCEMARKYAGCEVLHQDFLSLELPDSEFHGVFANATLFHVPSQELGRVLSELNACLKPDGVLFSSNPRGRNVEGWNGTRYGAYHDLAGWTAFMNAAGFSEVLHYYRPKGRPREEQPWLASVWRKNRDL